MDTTSNLEREYYNKENGLHYTLVGDYYLPNLTSREEDYTPGIWAKRRLLFLKEHRSVSYTTLITSEKLNAHLKEVDEQTEKMMEELVSQMKARKGVTEELKRRDPMRWVGLMNNINHCAREIVDSTVIYA